MTFKDLESKVVNEIDSWDIIMKHNGNPVKYSDKLNCLLYGPGIDAVRKICDSYKSSKTPQTDFSQLNYGDAKEEFLKQYILYHLEKNDFNTQETAKAIGTTYGNLRQHMMKKGIKARELKKSQERETPKPFNPVAIAEDTFNEYEGLFSPQMLNTFLKRKKKILADRLSKVALEIVQEPSEGFYADRYLELPFSMGPEKFRKDYIDFMINTYKNGPAIAEAMGMTYGSFRGLLHEEGIKLRENGE
jgi:hypothetical protein